MTWVYELEEPHFYNMLVSEWQTTSAWTGLTWQQYKGELLRVRGMNVMSIAEYQSAFQMGVFPFYHLTFNGLYRLFVSNSTIYTVAVYRYCWVAV
jgi:hypothetical protein